MYLCEQNTHICLVRKGEKHMEDSILIEVVGSFFMEDSIFSKGSMDFLATRACPVCIAPIDTRSKPHMFVSSTQVLPVDVDCSAPLTRVLVNLAKTFPGGFHLTTTVEKMIQLV